MFVFLIIIVLKYLPISFFNAHQFVLSKSKQTELLATNFYCQLVNEKM